MTTNLKEFEKDVDKFKQKIERSLVRFHKDITKALYAEILETSPLWSGQFIASHNVSINSVDKSIEINPLAEQTEWPTTPDFVLIPKPASYVAGVLKELQPYSIVFISNSQLYARELEKGKSKQAAQGVYFVSTQKIRARFSRGRRIKVP